MRRAGGGKLIEKSVVLVIVGQLHEGVRRGNRLGLGPALDPAAAGVYRKSKQNHAVI